MTEAVVRRAEGADLAAIAWLRRQWTQEQDGDLADPGFDERLSDWFARESSRRIIWLAEADGHPVGMMNLAIFERMPRPGSAPSRWDTSVTRSSSRHTAIRASARNSSAQCSATRTKMASPGWW